jgi:hypothetical protein
MTNEKRLEDMTAEELAELKIEFAPGAFDDFEGTQEELDELVSEIQRMFASGEFLENTQQLDLEALAEEDPELAEKLLASLDSITDRKNLQ